MKEPLWLQSQPIEMAQSELIARFGGLEGLRNGEILEENLTLPVLVSRNTKTDLFALAAKYVQHLVTHHAFLDGNKRTGFMAAYTFLGINGYQVTAPEEQAVIMTRDLAAGETDEATYAKWLEDNCVQR